MKKIILAFLLVVLSSSVKANPIIVIRDIYDPNSDFGVEVLPPPDEYYELFSPERQNQEIVDGMIDMGPRSYSVFEDYTITERQRIWQECQKDLIYNDQDTLLYMYQFIVKPDFFPYDEITLQVLQNPVPLPASLLLVMIGAALLVLQRRI